MLGASALVVGGLVALATPAIVLPLSSSEPARQSEPLPTITARPLPATGMPSGTPTAEPAAVAAPEPSYAPCDEFAGWQPVEYTEGTLNGLVPVFLVDSGPIRGANGQTNLDGSSRPASYVVAEGDTLGAIAERFCTGMNPEVIEWLNVIRWDTGYSSGGNTPMRPQPGDVINLNPHTIATVGAARGAPRAYHAPFTIPGQW